MPGFHGKPDQLILDGARMNSFLGWLDDLQEKLRGDGQERLADLADAIPKANWDDHHDRLEALAPEALALARSAKLPWLEVF
ncbi:MAG TPA: hypothetical protein VKT70_04085, partial [Stellaceae bacterium]|nr:hypothetical protein [Stellaceae bacterium]